MVFRRLAPPADPSREAELRRRIVTSLLGEVDVVLATPGDVISKPDSPGSVDPSDARSYREGIVEGLLMAIDLVRPGDEFAASTLRRAGAHERLPGSRTRP